MSATTSLIAGFAVGGLLCFVIGWMLGSRRRMAVTADNRLEEELRQQVAQKEGELSKLRAQLAEATNARAAAEAKPAAAEKLLGEQREMHQRTLQETKELQAKAIAQSPFCRYDIISGSI